ncbi:hypothetical protein [Sphingomonas sp. 28-63-12]|uniref:hypothetical protein n=1 Tax=Sphingomonas sp. 28-63-12 TaxID=1970434 RepID=UPI000BCA0DD6|nr:MAG: hypothetical protein B7Y47_04625 [Sphingomonas sp. 28-63-12]
MMDPTLYVTLAGTTLAGLAMITLAGLAGWRGWLTLKQQELIRTHPEPMPAMTGPSASARIEIADLKERIRKLEAIAAGVDL